jgi:hypothetical protein
MECWNSEFCFCFLFSVSGSTLIDALASQSLPGNALTKMRCSQILQLL